MTDPFVTPTRSQPSADPGNDTATRTTGGGNRKEKRL